jgi:ankyrin repeat protein
MTLRSALIAWEWLMLRRSAIIAVTALMLITFCAYYYHTHIGTKYNLDQMLIVAVRSNSPELVRGMLERGASANARGLGTPNTDAASPAPDAKRPGAKKDAAAEDYPTVLATALNLDEFNVPGPSPEVNYEIVKLLLDHGADIGAADFLGTPALASAVSHGYYATTRLLLDHGADVNGRSNTGEPVLFYDYFDADNALLRLLLDRGAAVNAADSNGNTMLIHACSAGAQAGRIELLLDRGADVNAMNRRGRTALMEAAYRNRPDLIALLLHRGAKTDLHDRKGNTALMIARKRGKREAMKTLMAHGVK